MDPKFPPVAQSKNNDEDVNMDAQENIKEYEDGMEEDNDDE